MKLSKKLSVLLASVSMLTFAVAPVIGSQKTQTAQAATAYDLPDGTIVKAPSSLMALNFEAGESNVFLWTFNGNQRSLSNRGVQNHSWWYTDEYRVFDGEKYYRVSTNEWVNYNDIDEIDFENGDFLLGAQIRG